MSLRTQARADRNEYNFGFFTNYCGLGGSGPVRNAVDLGCKIHDEAYSKYMEDGLGPYMSYVKADEDLFNYLSHVKSKSVREEIARIGTMAYAATKKMFPSLPSTWSQIGKSFLNMPRGRKDSPFPSWMDDIISAEVNAAASILPLSGSSYTNHQPSGTKRNADGEPAEKKQRTDDVPPKTPPSGGTVAKSDPTIEPASKEPAAEFMEDVGADTTVVALRSSGGSSLQERGEETQITAIPRHVPIGLPETVNFTHKIQERLYFELSSDTFNDNFDGFNVIVKLNDPWNATTPAYTGGGVYVGTATATDDGGRGATYTTAGTPSYFNYFAAMYKYWTVTHTKVKLYYRDFGIRGAGFGMLNAAYGSLPCPSRYYMDYPYIMYRDFGSQKDSEATLTGYNGRKLMDDRHMKCKQFVPSSVRYWEDLEYESVNTTGTSPRVVVDRPFLDCVIEENFTHKSYERLMDVAGDSSDVVWTAVGANHPLSHTFEARHRYWDWAGHTATLGASAKYFMFVDVCVEYQMQWKELNPTSKLHRAYYGTPTFP